MTTINSDSVLGALTVEMDAEMPQDVTGSRTGGTWYQNTADHPVFIYIQASTGGNPAAVARLTVHLNTSQTDNVMYRDSSQAADTSSPPEIKTSAGLLVPPDHYYKVEVGGSAVLDRWHEQAIGRS
jgi:hypothetical protein